MRDTIKSVAWGALLLACAIGVLIGGLLVYMHSSDYMSVDIAKKAQRLNFITRPKIDQLVPLFREARKDYTKISGLRESVRADIERECQDCRLYFFPSDSYEAESLTRRLDLLGIEENITKHNIAKSVALTFSILLLLLCFYLMAALFKFKELRSDGVTILVILVLPWCSFSLFMATFGVSEYFEYKTHADLWVAIFSLVYIFLAYPPVWRYVASRNIGLLELLKLRRS